MEPLTSISIKKLEVEEVDTAKCQLDDINIIVKEDGTTQQEEPKEEILSKKAKKRQLKKQKWLQYRPILRKKEKEKMKLRKKEARLKNIKLGPCRKALKNCKMSTSKCKVRVILDFSFDALMSEKDLNKCIQQLNRCYSSNRRCENPLQFYVTSLNGPSKTVLEKYIGYTNWDINFFEEPYLNIFKREELVYLTSESDNIINEIDEEKVYIIGALVDHNFHKGVCLKVAIEQGIQHGRLPLNQHIEMKTRQVLTIDHVFTILVNVASSGLSWKDAFLKILPKRKGAAPKSPNEMEKQNQNGVYDLKTEDNENSV